MVLAAAIALSASGLRAQNEFGPAQAYVVQKGDTAASLARRFYGKSALGKKLWQANRNLVAHPQKLTAGDTIYIFPEATLAAGKVTAVPPPPLTAPTELYDRGQLFSGAFPKYVNFLADGRGLGEAGAIRIGVKHMAQVLDPETGRPATDPRTGQPAHKLYEALYEVRDVGLVLASAYHGSLYYGDSAEKAAGTGKTILSTNDNVILQFTEDLGKILDSDTYGDSDPYFREFAIYGRGAGNRAPDRNRVDRGRNLGELYSYKGLVTVVARVDGLAPLPPKAAKKLKNKKGAEGARGQDMEPVSYVARITYTEDAV
ncbi:MAG: LysM domain-containing protein, partial [Candidatus Adiutrix sp.]|nr:LysM domain-containing protein [Candidatus Adiutrix sp.]